MTVVFALTHHTGISLAEVGFLLVLFAGVWLAAAQIPQLKLWHCKDNRGWGVLAIAGALLIIATHWGHFGWASYADSPPGGCSISIIPEARPAARGRWVTMADVFDTSDAEMAAATERLLIRPWHLDEVDRFYEMRRRVASRVGLAPGP